MCEVSRREFLIGSAGILSVAGEAELLQGAQAVPQGKPDPVASDVYFHQGSLSDNADAVCNNGWVVMEDYVLVIDANFPAGAREIISKIRSITQKPIRFAFDTHHHGDHSYGNQVFLENGAVPVAHAGVLEEMKRYETGYFGKQPGSWESAAKTRKDLQGTRLKPPSVLFPKELYFDDGKHRVELIHPGVAHTHGDAVAWLPKERILFAGDVCVNGPFNYVGDGDVGQWVGTLDAVKKLGAKVICPGHGARAEATVLDDQQAFFKALREQVGQLMAKKSPQEARGQLEAIRANLKANAQIARFVGERGAGWDPLSGQIEKVYLELTGRKLAAAAGASEWARAGHARSHGAA